MPVGPHILWPESARKSQPSACTSSGGLRGIDERKRTDGAGAGAEVGGRVDRSERVGNVRKGEEPDLRREKRIERGEVEAALAVGPEERHKPERRAGRSGDFLPGDEVAVVLHLGGQHDVTGPQIGAAPSVGDEVHAFGRPASEEDFLGVRCADEAGEAGAGPFVAIGRAHGERVQSAMHVAVIALVVVDERIDHGARFLRGRSVIEVDEWLAVYCLVENREGSANRLQRGGGKGVTVS